MRREMSLDDRPHQLAKLVRLYRVQLDRDGAGTLRPAIGRLGPPRRQIPSGNLLKRDRDALEMDFRCRRHFAQRLFDLLAGIYTGWIEVAEVIDEGRNRQ